MSHGPIKQSTPKVEASFKTVDVFFYSSSFKLLIISFVWQRLSLNQIAITCIYFSQDDDDGRGGNDMCINIFHLIISAYTLLKYYLPGSFFIICTLTDDKEVGDDGYFLSSFHCTFSRAERRIAPPYRFQPQPNEEE